MREILREKVRERFEPLKNLLMQLFTQLLTHFILLTAGRLGSRWNLSENPGTCGSSWNLFAPSENPCRLQALVVLKLPGISLKTFGSCGKLLEPSGTFRLGVPISTQYEGAARNQNTKNTKPIFINLKRLKPQILNLQYMYIVLFVMSIQITHDFIDFQSILQM